MRKSFYSIGSIIILLLAAIIFVIIPATEGIENASKLPPYGYYAGKPVRYTEHSDFYDQANYEIERFEAQGVDFTTEYASLYYSTAFSNAFVNTIGPMALEEMSTKAGYKTPAATVDRMIMSMPEYRDETGVFSPSLYRATPDSQKIKIRNSLAVQLARQKSYSDIFGTQDYFNGKKLYGFKSSDAEIAFIMNIASKESSFDVAAFDMNTFPKEEQVKFGKEHQDLFVKYNISVVTCDSQAKAKECLNRLSKEEINFEQAVAEYSNKAYGNPETGLLSASYAYQLNTAVKNEEDAKAVMALSKDQLSEVIECPSGFSIFKCNDTAVQPDFENDSIVQAAYSYLLTREKTVIEDYFTAKAKDFTSVAAVKGFDEACQQMNIVKASVPPCVLNYGDTKLLSKTSFDSVKELSGVSTNENFLKAVFALNKNETSAPIVLGSSNCVVVVKCTDITAIPASEETKGLVASEISETDLTAINYAILYGPKVKNNSDKFMAVFNGTGK